MGFIKRYYAKTLLNEKGELSYRKAGVAIGSVGTFFMLGGVPGVQFIVAGKALFALGAAIAFIGKAESDDRKADAAKKDAAK